MLVEMRTDASMKNQGVVRSPVANQATPPNPEVVERPAKRTFTTEYKQRILRETDRCKPGEIGALLRREGLYRSHVHKWREQWGKAEQEALAPKKRGRKAKEPTPESKRIADLERENARLQRRLKRAEAVIDLQKKISEILGIPLSPTENDDND